MAENQTERSLRSGSSPESLGQRPEGGWASLFDAVPALRRTLAQSRMAIAAERMLPILLLPGAVLAVFLTVSFAGLWGAMGPLLRIAGVFTFAGAFIVSLIALRRWRYPSREEAGRRLDAETPALHRPLETLTDRAAQTGDPIAEAIWSLHRKRTLAAAANVRPARLTTDVARRDPLALRLGLVLALVVTAFLAGHERWPRVLDAFAWSNPLPPPVPRRLDAWVDPPPYTGRPPIFLSGSVGAPEAIAVPIGSALVIRVTPGEDIAVNAPAGFTISADAPSGARAPASPASASSASGTASALAKTFEARYTIGAAGTLDIRHGGETLAQFSLTLIPDLPPKVELVGVERDERETGLKLIYRAEDDYGIAKSETIVTRADGKQDRVLFPAPSAIVGIRPGEGDAMLVTEDHAWAGMRVEIKLAVSDDIGQSAQSEARTAVLPQRRFTNPIAKALVEQRRNLVFAPDDKDRVSFALAGLIFAPSLDAMKPGDFIALDLVYRLVRSAKTDDDLRTAADRLYELALAIDQGDLSEAERRLREAQDRLAEALDRNASADEIKRLTEELRRAMDEFLREFAQREQRDGERQAQNQDGRPERTITQRDLQEMLRRIEELSRSGNTEEAQRLLRELNELMRNLRSAQRQNGNQRSRELGQALDELDQLQRDQQDLRDRTFRDGQQRGQRGQQQGQRGQQQGQRGQRGQRGQQGQQGQQGEQGEGGEGQEGEGSGLEQEQRALRDRLNRLRERLRRQGADPGEGFGEADEGMGDAQGQLGQGQSGRATQGQQRALDGMGRSMQGLNDQMRQEMGDGTEDADGGPGYGRPGETQRGRAESTTDPLGRPMPQRRDALDNSRVRIPQRGESQGTLNERAQRVLEELRRRLGEFDRPREDLDYFERLLRRTE